MPPQTIQKSILLIDDDHYVSDFYADAFRNAGYDADVAVGAADALKKLRLGKKYRVVMFDVSMLAVDGFELYEMIKKESLALDSVFMVLTNSAEPDKIQKAKQLGINTYLIKSATIPVEAVSKVNQALEEKIQI